MREKQTDRVERESDIETERGWNEEGVEGR